MAQFGWKNISPGGAVTRPGSSVEYDTGSWRVKRPVIDFERCTHCMICWIFCPDSCFEVKEGKLIGADLAHCKGCGICAVECPRNCINMVEEVAARAEEAKVR